MKIFNEISPGTTLLLHSSLSRTIKNYEVTPKGVLEALLAHLGPEGTLLLPTFNFDFTDGTPFDIRETPSQMGALTEIARSWPGAVRTGHPVYSFAAIGARAAEFRGVNNRSAYGEDSPFGMLRRLGGEIAVLDLPDQNSMTFYHHVEEVLQVSYRYRKEFTGEYIDGEGVSSRKTYDIYVRDLAAGVLTSVDRMGENLWGKGLYRGDRPKAGTGLRVIPADELFREVENVINSGLSHQFLYEVS